MRQIACVLGVLLLSACASTPEPHYYTLDMTPPQAPVAEHLVRVARFTAAEPLIRRNILIKTSPTQIEYYIGHQWAASPAELVAGKLASEFGAGGEQPLFTLDGEVLAMEQVDTPHGADAQLKLRLAVRSISAPRSAAPLIEKVYDQTLPVQSSTPAAVVRALSEAASIIADEAAADLHELAAARGQESTDD